MLGRLKRIFRLTCASLGSLLNRFAYKTARLSRACVRFMNHHVTHEESDWFTYNLSELHQRIRHVLKKQRHEAIESLGDIFRLESKQDIDKGTRHLYLFRQNKS